MKAQPTQVYGMANVEASPAWQEIRYAAWMGGEEVTIVWDLSDVDSDQLHDMATAVYQVIIERMNAEKEARS